MGIVNTLYFHAKQFNAKRRVLILRLNSRIKIGKKSMIYKNTVVETNNGGSIKIGADCEIMPGVCIMTYGGIIKIGDRCSINPYTVIYGPGKGTIIGNDVLIAGHCMIVSVNHNFEDISKPINQQGWNSKGIVIEDNVWIAGGCRILDGITIGNGAIVAAGSVVNKDVPKNAIVAGAPAVILKYRVK